MDVLDPATGTVYDYRFVMDAPGLGAVQISKILRHVPGVSRVVEVNP